MLLVIPLICDVQCSPVLAQRASQINEIIEEIYRTEPGRKSAESFISSLDRKDAELVWSGIINKAEKFPLRYKRDKMLYVYDIAKNISISIKNDELLVRTYCRLGGYYSIIGENNDAYKLYMQCHDGFKSLNDHAGVIGALAFLSPLALALFRDSEAEYYSDLCLRIAKTDIIVKKESDILDVDVAIASAYAVKGGLCLRRNEYLRSLQYYQKAVECLVKLDQANRIVSYNLSDNLISVGNAYSSLGMNREALASYSQGLIVARKHFHIDRIGSALNNMGLMLLYQEDYSRAIFYLAEASRIFNAIKRKIEANIAVLNLGVGYQKSGEIRLAEEKFLEAFHFAKQINNQDVIIAAGEGLGAVYREKGAYDQAMDILDRSLSLAKDLNDNVRIAEILWRKAEVHYDLEQYDQAIELGSRSLEIARNLQFSNLYILASTLVAKSLIKRKDPASAESMLRSTVNEIENQRNRIAGREMSQQLYFENKVIPYHLLIDLNIGKADVFSALSNAERVKGRVLLDALRNGRALPQREMSGIEKDEQRRLNQSIVNLNRALRAELEKETHNQESIDKVKSELTDARLKYSTFLDLLQSSRTAGAGQREIEVSPTVDPASLKKLPSDTVFISFTVTDNRTWVFLITNSDGGVDVSARALDIARKDLREVISDLHKTLSARSLGFNAVSRKVYDLLIRPLEGSFTGKKKLCVIPDDILWDAPFQTLIRRNGRYLIEDYAISYAPSLSVYLQMRAKENHASSGESNSLLAFGNPLVGEEAAQNIRDQQRGGSFEPLPHAEVEVRTVLPMFRDKSSRALIREEAEERKFKSLAGGYRTLHLATHGVLDNQNPLYSYLLLSRKDDDPEEDGILEAREILEMELNADLAVLSACETARGRIGSGEGMVGMAWAFFVAGCRSTIVSQWRVDSEGTAKFMIDFYRSLERTRRTGGMSKSEALRSAALGMVSSPRYRHPYYWAGFILIGLDN